MLFAVTTPSEAAIYVATVTTVAALAALWFKRDTVLDGLTLSGARGVVAKATFALIVVGFIALTTNLLFNWIGTELRYLSRFLIFAEALLIVLFTWIAKWPPAERA